MTTLSLCFTLADFFQFLAACCQTEAFKIEKEQDENKENYSPVDFMTNKTWLDFIKVH